MGEDSARWDELGPELVALVRQPRLVVDPVAAVRQRQHVEVARVDCRVVVRLLELARALAAQAGEPDPLEPVLLLVRAAVVGGTTVGQHCRESGATRAPHAETRRERGAAPIPFGARLGWS